MFELAKPKVKVADLKHRIALCTMHDVIEKDGNMSLIREVKSWQWAAVDAALNLPSFIGSQGYAVMETPIRATHRVIIRAQSQLEISAYAWVYEIKRISSPRWYKCLGFTESDSWILINCHLVQRSTEATPPVTPVHTPFLQPDIPKVDM